MQKPVFALTAARFEPQERPRGRTTDVWTVFSRCNDLLGEVRWFMTSRSYCFAPAAGVVFAPDCLQAIQRFIDRASMLRSA